MRQLCNVAYAVITESLDEDDLKSLNDQLEAAPWEKVEPRSRGTESLMGLFGPGGMAQA